MSTRREEEIMLAKVRAIVDRFSTTAPVLSGLVQSAVYLAPVVADDSLPYITMTIVNNDQNYVTIGAPQDIQYDNVLQLWVFTRPVTTDVDRAGVSDLRDAIFDDFRDYVEAFPADNLSIACNVPASTGEVESDDSQSLSLLLYIPFTRTQAGR